MTRRRMAAAAMFAATAAAAFVLGLTVADAGPAEVQNTTTVSDAEPYCPTEDSCTADYRDGKWHIEEAQP